MFQDLAWNASKRDWSIIFDWISAPALCIVVILADFYSNGNFPCSSDLSKIMVRHEAACQSLGPPCVCHLALVICQALDPVSVLLHLECLPFEGFRV